MNIDMGNSNKNNLCFIMGAPRSGTTWVWGLLSSHPNVQTITRYEMGITQEETSESGLFIPGKNFKNNLIIFEKKLNKINKGEILIEKTPEHTLFYKNIINLYPKANIIYVDRSYRSIINSMMKTSFIKNANNVNECIMKLRPYINNKNNVIKLKNTLHIYYELLLNNTHYYVKKMLNFLKLNDDDKIIKQIIEENYQKSKIKREGVYRKGKPDSWKQEMMPQEVKIINHSTKLNILIANYELINFFGGTQTWTITMKHALAKLGHNVDIAGLKKGYNVHFKKYINPLKQYYDVLIANGNKTLTYFSDRADIKIFISHGVLPDLEQPVPGADIYLAVSEETANNLKKQGYECKGILRNPIDLNKFTFNKITNKKLETIAFLDRRRVFPFIENVQKDFRVIQIGNPPLFDIPKALEKSDLVVALGRGAYESMALGKNVIVSGNNSGRFRNAEIMDGFITPKRFFEFRKNNCSGRYSLKKVTCYKQFKNELDLYHQKYSMINNELISENNDANKIAKQLLNII